jgi:serine/threonine protein kinase
MMYMNQSIDWQGKMLGRYRLLQLLGRGGMGEVWLGEDTQLRRQIAVKMLPIAHMSDVTYLQDFEREARAAAALEHPNILPVHDFGKQQIAEDRVITYLIMPYIHGGSLRDRLRTVNGPLPPDEALHYLQQAAQAIDFAHSQQVLHRDIKAANMLLQQDWLFLADFGIAKLLTSTTQRGQTHAGAGTPEYMAPEQVQGKAEFASDRYSLAVIAYQLCTGHLPFQGETPYTIMMKQITEMPSSPRQFNAAMPVGVEQAILWGLRKHPEERPPSCKAFVEAIEQGLHPANLPQADPEATVLAPWSKRQPTYAQQAGYNNIYPMPPTQQTPPVQSQHGAQSPVGNTPFMPTVPETPRSSTYPDVPTNPPAEITGRKVSRRAMLIGGGAATLAVVGGAGILEYLHAASSRNPVAGHSAPTATPTPVPGPHKLIKGVPLLSLTGHTRSVDVLAWDASGRYLATGSEDTHVMLWDIPSLLPKNATGMQSVATPQHDWKIPVTDSTTFGLTPNALCWSGDGHTVAVVTNGSNIYLFNTSSNAGAPDIYQDSSQSNSINSIFYTCIAWSPETNSFATNESSLVHTQLQANIWQAGKKTGPVQNFSYQDANTSNPSAEIYVLGWSEDGIALSALTNYGLVLIWNARTGSIQQILNLPNRPAPKDNGGIINNACMAWSPADSHQLVASDIDIASVWDTRQNKLLLTLQLNEPVFKEDNLSYYVWGLSWSPNGKYIAMCYPKDPKIYIWNVQTTGPSASLGTTRTQLLSFPDHPLNTAAITDVAWSPDGRYIAASSADTTVIVWKVDAS